MCVCLYINIYLLKNFKSSIFKSYNFTCFHANAYFKDIITVKKLKANLKDTKNIVCVCVCGGGGYLKKVQECLCMLK